MAARLIALLFALMLASRPALAAEPEPTITTEETYRRAAEAMKGRALEERERRRACAEDLEDERRRAEAWKAAAKARPESKTPEWLWPSAAAVAIAAFAAGFLLAHQDRRD